MIYFYSGITHNGGSTMILSRDVELLNEAGVPALFVGPDPWFERLSQYNKAGPFPKLRYEDSLVCHLHDLTTRPDVRRCLFVAHEETFHFQAGLFICDVCAVTTTRKIRTGGGLGVCKVCSKRRATFTRLAAFDHVIFSSEAHAKKSHAAQMHWGEWSVIPNPVEVDFTWEPPTEPIAGVIGRVEHRKQPHVSVREAQARGFKKVLLYGDKDDAYFDEYIAPILSPDVRYLGLCMDRKAMYDSVSEVFHHSAHEQALMVLGECKKLGIPFHGSAAVHDWDLASDADIVGAWVGLLRAEHDDVPVTFLVP